MPDTTIFHAEAESAVIGAVMINPDLINYIDLRVDEFYIGKNKVVWKAITDLARAHTSVDFVTLTERLESSGKLDAVGGAAGLTAYLSDTTYSSYNAKDYAAIVRDKARRRAILQAATDLAKLAHSENDIDAGISAHISALSTATQSSKGAVQWSTYFDQLYDEAAERYADPRDTWGIPTGFAAFDRVTGGLQPSELMILSGEPGVGKSILAMQMASNMADNAPGAIYSLEMTGRAVARRLVSAQAKIPTRAIKTGKLQDEEWEKLTRIIDILRNKPVYMSESETWTTASLRADLTRLKVQYQVKWFVVDYLYLMSDAGETETEKTQNISRGLKQICKALDLSGLAIHSMNKAGMQNGDTGKKPGQADLRGSAQVNYDADLICFLKEFTPVTSQEKLLIKPSEMDNMNTLWFSKGRELENPRRYIHLVKQANYPYFGDYQEVK